jgi:hypothetical protein
VSDARARRRTLQYLPGTPLYALGIAIAFVNTYAAVAFWGLLAVWFLLPPPE